MFVKVIGADGLVVDAGCECNTYALLEKGPRKRRTKTVKNTTTPAWNEVLAFDGASGVLKVRQ